MEHLSPEETTAFDLPAQVVFEQIAVTDAVAEAARQARAREQSLQLGIVVYQLALARNGLGEGGVEMSDLLNQTTHLLGELGMQRILTTYNYPAPVVPAEAMEVMPGLIQEAKNTKGLSLREVAARTSFSHSTVAEVLRGRASEQATLAVARALGIVPSFDGREA